MLIALARLTNNKVLVTSLPNMWILSGGTPVVVQLLIIYFAVLPRLICTSCSSLCAFGINSGAYVAELIRAGIQAVDKGQMEALVPGPFLFPVHVSYYYTSGYKEYHLVWVMR